MARRGLAPGGPPLIPTDLFGGPNMFDKFLKFRESHLWKILKRLQEIVIVVCASIATLIFVAEVIVRYVLKIDFLGYDELVLLFASWLYFIGGSYAMYKKEHISADMLPLFLKGRVLQIARVFVNWVVFMITLVLAVWGVDFFLYAMSRTANTTVWKIPLLASQSALSVGYILMAFYALIYSIEDMALAITDGKKLREKKKGGDA